MLIKTHKKFWNAGAGPWGKASGGGGGTPAFSADSHPTDQNLGYTSVTATFAAATGNGLVAICVYYVPGTVVAGAGISGVTLNGVAMAKAVGSLVSTSTEVSEIWYLAGQTANASSSIVFTCATQFSSIGMTASSITNVTATPVGTAVFNGANGGGSVDPHTVGPITIPSTGFGLVTWYTDGVTASVNSGWGGVLDFNNGNSATPNGGSSHTPSSGSITASMALGNFSNNSMAFASWGP